jgi:hypothetical protein
MLRILLVIVAFLLLLGMLVFLFRSSPANAAKIEAAKIDAAKAQIQALETGVNAYRLKHQGTPPEKLEVLLKADPAQGGAPYFKDDGAFTDPWGKRFQYAPDGIKGKTKDPAIWTTTPDNQTIANWQTPKK